MAKCRLCKKNIPDGIVYCEDCLDKKLIQTDESYLDSLLNSVKSSSEPIQNNYKKPQEPRNPEPVKTNNLGKKIRPGQIDPTDLADFNQYNISEDLEDLIMISDEELYGQAEDFTGADMISAEDNANHPEQDWEIHNTPTEENNAALDHQVPEASEFENEYMKMIDQLGQDSSEPVNSDMWHSEYQSEASVVPEPFGDQPEEEIQEDQGIALDDSLQGLQDNIDLDFLNTFSNPAVEELDGDSYDPSLGDLLSGFDLSDEEDNSNEESPVPELGGINNNDPDFNAQQQTKHTEEEEFLSLLGQFGTDDPVAADVQAITELLSNPVNKSTSESLPSSVGDVFSDALKAVSGLDDLEDANHSYPIQEELSEEPKAKKKRPKSKIKEKTDNHKVKATKGKGFFGKLFSNVVDDKVIKEAEQSKASVESAATKDKKKGKGKKGKKAASDNIEEVKDEPKRAVPREENPEDTKAKKKEKKSKKEKKKAIELIDDYEEIEGRINKLGATVVFTFFGIMVALLLIGTSLFTYSVSIKNAKTYFDRQKYTEAYNEVYGMELRDEDIELYEKIMTIMFVNKQLNSYNNYYAMKKYPEALDSLMKGLKRYDKYIELATMLGIKSDLDYVRDQIMGELEHVYQLTEKETEEILSIKSQRDYSIAVYNAVMENMKY